MDKKKSKQQDVLVIGAGASGMMTAITAVTVLEHMDKPGKKILATGNGKCNFTNLKMSPRCYYGDHGLVQEILKQFTVEDTLAFFREIGIWPKEKNGYVYPNSGQASCDIRQLCETKYGFEVRTSMGTYCSHNLVFATGLRAAPKSGSDGSMISLIKSFGHRFEPILPALCGFEAEGMEFSKVSGVRTDALLSLYIDGQKCEQERGELQLADYGISGISGQQSGLESTVSKKTGRTYHQFSAGFFRRYACAGTAAQIFTGCRDTGCRRITSWAFKP